MSVFFLPKGGVPSAFVPGATSITCSFAPADVFAANVKRVDGVEPPSTVRSAKAAAWPSIGWLTFFSFEYSCIAPMMRFGPGYARREVGEWEGVRAAEGRARRSEHEGRRGATRERPARGAAGDGRRKRWRRAPRT